MGENVRNKELKMAITYMETSTVLAKFMDVKSALWDKYKKSVTGSVEECQQRMGQLVKNLETATGITDSRIMDITKEDTLLPEELTQFVKCFCLDITEDRMKIWANNTMQKQIAKVYQTLPRGNNFSYTTLLNPEFEVTVTNCFEPYPTEGFSLAFDLGNFQIAFVPENKDGIKGTGVLNIYGIYEGKIYRDNAAKYMENTEDIVKVFRG